MFNFSSIESYVEPTYAPDYVVIQPKNMENLGTIGVFASSLLLSLGGCIAVVFSSLRQSRCKNISCCGVSCQRENLQAPEITV